MNEFKREMIAMVATMAFLFAAFIAVVAIAADASYERHQQPRVCFAKQTWSADDGDRPCVTIRLYEDGSFRSHVREADGDPWPSD